MTIPSEWVVCAPYMRSVRGAGYDGPPILVNRFYLCKIFEVIPLEKGIIPGEPVVGTPTLSVEDEEGKEKEYNLLEDDRPLHLLVKDAIKQL